MAKKFHFFSCSAAFSSGSPLSPTPSNWGLYVLSPLTSFSFLKVVATVPRGIPGTNRNIITFWRASRRESSLDLGFNLFSTRAAREMVLCPKKCLKMWNCPFLGATVRQLACHNTTVRQPNRVFPHFWSEIPPKSPPNQFLDLCFDLSRYFSLFRTSSIIPNKKNKRSTKAGAWEQSSLSLQQQQQFDTTPGQLACVFFFFM